MKQVSRHDSHSSIDKIDMNSTVTNNTAAKVWSCGNEHCPHDRYWPRTLSYTTDYEHSVWGSDKKFRQGVDTCGMPQFVFLSELGPERGTIVGPKHCQHPVLRVTAGTQLRWRKSSVRPKVHLLQAAFQRDYNQPINNYATDDYRTWRHKYRQKRWEGPTTQ